MLRILEVTTTIPKFSFAHVDKKHTPLDTVPEMILNEMYDKYNYEKQIKCNEKLKKIKSVRVSECFNTFYRWNKNYSEPYDPQKILEKKMSEKEKRKGGKLDALVKAERNLQKILSNDKYVNSKESDERFIKSSNMMIKGKWGYGQTMNMDGETPRESTKVFSNNEKNEKPELFTSWIEPFPKMMPNKVESEMVPAHREMESNPTINKEVINTEGSELPAKSEGQQLKVEVNNTDDLKTETKLETDLESQKSPKILGPRAHRINSVSAIKHNEITIPTETDGKDCNTTRSQMSTFQKPYHSTKASFNGQHLKTMSSTKA